MAAQEAPSATQVRFCLYKAFSSAFMHSISLLPIQDLLSRTNSPDTYCAKVCAGCCNLGQTVFNGACADFVSAQPDRCLMATMSLPLAKTPDSYTLSISYHVTHVLSASQQS